MAGWEDQRRRRTADMCPVGGPLCAASVCVAVRD